MHRDEDLRRLADEYWELTLDTYPSYATFIGDRRFDDRIEDLRVEAETEYAESVARIGRQVEAIDPDLLSTADHVTRGLLLAEVRNAELRTTHRLVEHQCDQMTGIHADLIQLAGQTNAPEPDHALMLVERYGQVGTYLDQAVERFRDGAASGRPPARINVERSLNQLDGYLASDLDTDPFVTMAGPDSWDGEEDWRAQLRQVVTEVIRPGLQRYRDALAAELAPIGRPDDAPGLCHLPGGGELYAALIEMHTSTTLDPETIHQIGMEEIGERLPDEYRELGARLFDTTDLGEIFDRLRTDPSLRYGSGDEIMADAVAALDRARTAMGDWFGRLPQSDCLIEAVPDYLAADAPAAYYFPPSGDGTRPGTYFVNTHNPGDKARFEAESIGYHEAIPGHHLQIAIATELDGVPDFQRFSLGNTAYVEGWALYTERLADEMGLYGSDLDRMGMLTADSWRAGRLVVDTGLHAMGWSRQQAIDFLADHTPLDREEITVEIDRYIGMPGQALSYKLGQREFFRLRERARTELGSRFDIKGFHDAVLEQGSVTLPILADLVDDWVMTLS